MSTQSQYGQVQVNTIQDHLNFAGGLMLAVGSAGAFITLKAVSLPVVAVTFGLAAAMTCGVKALHIADQKLGAAPAGLMGKITHEAITKFTLAADYYNLRRFDGFHALPEVADILAQRLGLKKTPALRIIDPSADEDGMGKLKLLKKLSNAMMYFKTGNAFECTLTPSLLQHLEDKEEVAVVGHEFGHAAANHITKQMVLGVAPKAVSWAATYGYVATAYNHACTYQSMAIALGSVILFAKLAKQGIFEKNGLCMAVFGAHASLALTPVAMGHPEIGAAYMTMVTTGMVRKIVCGGYSRAAEFQADRLGAQSSGEPMALASSLKKIERFNKQELVMMEEVQEKTKVYPKFISDLYSSHPATARRIARLKKIHNSIA